MKTQQRGFTLMEMVAVIAVIAILASLATPMIFNTIREARVTGFASDVGVVRTAVANYYNDTGEFPTHIPTDNRDGRQLLRRNANNRPVGGWDGPYIESELANPFDVDGYRAVLVSANQDYQFDLDGDGNVDTSNVALIRLDGVADREAKKLSDIIDGDGDVVQGNGAWNAAGRVKRYGRNSNHPNRVIIFLAEE